MARSELVTPPSRGKHDSLGSFIKQRVRYHSPSTFNVSSFTPLSFSITSKTALVWKQTASRVALAMWAEVVYAVKPMMVPAYFISKDSTSVNTSFPRAGGRRV